MSYIIISLIIGLFILLFMIIKIQEQIVILQNKKFELRPGEKLTTAILKFNDNVSVTKEDGEPVDQITVVQYDNIRERISNET